MKKLFLSLAVVFSVAMVSCGGGNKEKEEAQDTPAQTEEVALIAVQEETPANGDSAANAEITGVTEETPAEANVENPGNN